MIIFKKAHDKTVNELVQENKMLIKENNNLRNERNTEYEENLLLKKNIAFLNNRNMRLKNDNAKKQQQHFETNAKLLNDLDQAKKEINELENKYKKLEKRKNAFETLYRRYKNTCLDVNRVNVSAVRKLWCNGEAKRQLRRLADNDEITNIYTLKKYIKELAMLIGI